MPGYFSRPDDLRWNFQPRGLCTSIQRERCRTSFPHCYKKNLFYSGELIAPGWCNMFKRYWTVPLLILTCLTCPTSTQRYTIGIPTSCSTNETTAIQQLPEVGYRGCFTDESQPRLLRYAYNGTDNMAVTTCVAFCTSRGYVFSGLEFSFECRCDNVLNPRVVPADQSNCNYACCADGSMACGGFWFTSVYEAIGSSPPQTANATDNSGPSPTQNPNATDYSGNHSNNATQDDGNNSNNTTNNGGKNSQTSNNITLGTAIGIGIPGLILSAVLVKMKLSKGRRNSRQGTCQPSTKASSIRSGSTESISPV